MGNCLRQTNIEAHKYVLKFQPLFCIEFNSVQSAYYIGQMIGSIVLGFLGDRIGRKKVFLIGIVLLIVCSFGMAIAPHWTIFGILRIGVGFAHPG